jgi:hypothetical protein
VTMEQMYIVHSNIFVVADSNIFLCSCDRAS